MKVDLPKLKNDVVKLGKGATVSSLGGGKTAYRNRSDNEYLLMSDQNAISKAIMGRIDGKFDPKKILVQFFQWDYIIDQYRSDEKYGKFLDKLKGFGIDKISMMDFSVFYSDEEERQRRNMTANFERAIFAQERGFKIMFNFNNMLDIEYNDCFPKELGTVIIDDNHAENKWFYRENLALEKLLKVTKVSDVIFMSGKTTLTHRSFMVNLLKENNVRIHVVPSQWKAISLWLSKKSA